MTKLVFEIIQVMAPSNQLAYNFTFVDYVQEYGLKNSCPTDVQGFIKKFFNEFLQKVHWIQYFRGKLRVTLFV